MSKRRAVMTEAQARRFIRAARAEAPHDMVEIITDAGTVRITPVSVAPAQDQAHDPRKPIPWT